MASLDQAPENEALMLLALWLLALLLPQVSRLPLVPLVLVSRQERAAGSVDIPHMLQAGSGAKEALAANVEKVFSNVNLFSLQLFCLHSNLSLCLCSGLVIWNC